ncbi:subtilisin-like protease sbt1.2 [Nicotiana attenuata]|uniref:Subtilisin-like protease sbt1.2 n=1 Tax=Nicotiana attenuata TaxID=49451 RepID=A0A1J6IWR2_NICAT|nr:subtilisin-like protease sbt1.2 [Nicotiana attenuata]
MENIKGTDLTFNIISAKPGIYSEGTKIDFMDTPSVAFFSSWGPNSASPCILKPDIIGPGVNILAAWLFSMKNIKGTDSTFNIISGTSMSYPHLSGVAALTKSVHPDWLPAAIKFVIMTTADQSNFKGQSILDERKLPDDIFAIGAGHINPSKAISSISEAELNYPSFSVVLGAENQNYTRIVTNVGDANSIYVVSITQIPGVHTVVEPIRIVFSKVNQQATYMISFTRTSEISRGFVQGSISWILKKHVVRSPISISLKQGILVNESPEVQIGFVFDVIEEGPNSASPGILKPDIIGPGVNILAAWLFSMENIKGTDSIFNIIPGTSMSCPHLSDIAALLKSAHLNWSPAAIKFAIMTTADQSNHEGQPILDERKLPADVFAIGAGHIIHQKQVIQGLFMIFTP